MRRLMRAARLASMRWAARVSAGLHQALHPLPARNEWGEDRGEGKPIKRRLLFPASPRSDGGEGWGEAGRFYWFPLASVLSPLVPRGERMESLMQPCLGTGKSPEPADKHVRATESSVAVPASVAPLSIVIARETREGTRIKPGGEEMGLGRSLALPGRPSSRHGAKLALPALSLPLIDIMTYSPTH